MPKVKSHCRSDRIGRLLQRQLAQQLLHLVPALPVMTTISAVSVSADMAYARIYVSVLGDLALQEQVLRRLKSEAVDLRLQLARQLQLRMTPELRFVLDHSITRAEHLHRLIDDVQTSSA